MIAGNSDSPSPIANRTFPFLILSPSYEQPLNASLQDVTLCYLISAVDVRFHSSQSIEAEEIGRNNMMITSWLIWYWLTKPYHSYVLLSDVPIKHLIYSRLLRKSIRTTCHLLTRHTTSLNSNFHVVDRLEHSYCNQRVSTFFSEPRPLWTRMRTRMSCKLLVPA